MNGEAFALSTFLFFFRLMIRQQKPPYAHVMGKRVSSVFFFFKPRCVTEAIVDIN